MKNKEQLNDSLHLAASLLIGIVLGVFSIIVANLVFGLNGWQGAFVSLVLAVAALFACLKKFLNSDNE